MYDIIHRLKLLSLHSLTVFWTYVLGLGAIVLQLLLEFPDVANSVGLPQYVPTQFLPWYTGAIALLTLGARLRSILSDEHKDRTHEGPDDAALGPPKTELHNV